MPLIENSRYHPKPMYRNSFIQTTVPALFRKISGVHYQRERITTPDDDFLDLDWSLTGSDKLIIVSHGLEGSSGRPYVLGMVKAFNDQGWDALAWNFRSCSGEINRQLRFYHNGTTDDLDLVIRHAIGQNKYHKIVLAGFSMGGNLILNYLGQKASDVPSRVAMATVFSAPCDLTASAAELARPKNKIYMMRFLNYLRQKIRLKAQLFPQEIDLTGLNKIKTFKEFDDRYTAPIHGFKNAEDYWQRCSPLQYLKNITIPVMIINALDDPFLAGDCYPAKVAKASSLVLLELPTWGGHVGFIDNNNGYYWSEQRALEFMDR